VVMESSIFGRRGNKGGPPVLEPSPIGLVAPTGLQHDHNQKTRETQASVSGKEARTRGGEGAWSTKSISHT